MTHNGSLNECALIILGNSGVGKSFLANILLDKSHFQHKFSARSVTREIDFVRCQLGNRYYRIYNIPGLIEGDKERIALNKREIHRAFNEEKGKPVIIIYVFGHQNGRIRDEDVKAFHAFHEAYKFSSESLIIIVNGLSTDRPRTYNDDTEQILTELLRIKPRRLCFIDFLDSNDERYVNVRKTLIDAISNMEPRRNTSTQQINLPDEQVLQLRNDVDRLNRSIREQREEFTNITEDMERNYAAAERLSELRRLFLKAKGDLYRLVAKQQEEKNLILIIAQWQDLRVSDAARPMPGRYVHSQTQDSARAQLRKNRSEQHHTKAALKVCRQDIQQVCYELEQIYGDNLYWYREPIQQYYLLLNDIRFDPTIQNINFNFLEDLNVFTRFDLSDVE